MEGVFPAISSCLASFECHRSKAAATPLTNQSRFDPSISRNPISQSSRHGDDMHGTHKTDRGERE